MIPMMYNPHNNRVGSSSKEFGGFKGAFGEMLAQDAARHVMSGPSFYMGVDLGQKQDYTAIVILEQVSTNLHVRHIERLPLGTSYIDICNKIKFLMNRPPLKGRVNLVVDATGVGMPVCDSLRNMGLNLHAVTITAGNKASQEHDERGRPTRNWSVPKNHLVGCMTVLAESGRLAIASNLKGSRTLLEELEAFRSKTNALGHTALEAWRERDHDDLVLSTALACWFAEYGLRDLKYIPRLIYRA